MAGNNDCWHVVTRGKHKGDVAKCRSNPCSLHSSAEHIHADSRQAAQEVAEQRAATASDTKSLSKSTRGHDTIETFATRMEDYDKRLHDVASYGYSADGLQNGDEAYRIDEGTYVSEDDFKRIMPDENERSKYLLWANGGIDDGGVDLINSNDAHVLSGAVSDMFDSDGADNAYFTEIDDADFDEPEEDEPDRMYSTKREAVDAVITDAIEAHGNATVDEYDMDAIADAVIETRTDANGRVSYAQKRGLDADGFWDVVQRNAKDNDPQSTRGHDTPETFTLRMADYDKRLHDGAGYGYGDYGFRLGDAAYRIDDGVYVSDSYFDSIIPDENDRAKYLLWANGGSHVRSEKLINSEDSNMLRGAMADMLASDGGKNMFLDDEDSDNQ